MTAQELKEIKITWAALAAYYQKPLQDIVIAMYAEDVSEFDYQRVKQAFVVWRKNPKNRTAPLPSQIINLLTPEPIDDDSMAREICARILEAVSRFGYSNFQDAKAFVGETGWSVVRSYGGWETFCQGLGIHFSTDAFNAQARELLKGRIKHGPGIGDVAKALDYSKEKGAIAIDGLGAKLNLAIKQFPKG